MLIRCIPMALLTATLVASFSPSIQAAEEESATSKIVVFMPERIDNAWYWYYYVDTSQHIVQGIVEKKLIQAGFDVIDLNMVSVFHGDGDLGWITTDGEAVKKANELGAEYMIVGQATATMMSHDVAYGVNVFRSQADITAKLVRVSDGKILAVEEASDMAGSQAQQAAGRDALKSAGKKIGRAIVSATKKELMPAE